MASELLQRRVEFLLASQNRDGGWGYFPGRRSWLEPTAWSMLALHGNPDVAPAGAKAWELVRSWQLGDGSCRPNLDVEKPTWATSLWVTLHCIRGVYDAKAERAVNWLTSQRGAEGAWWRRTLRSWRRERDGFNAEWCGWAWWPGTSSWLEPTVHATVALRHWMAAGHGNAGIEGRIAEGERMLLDRRCQDGGWNYGVREALDHALPSYPETTGVALLGLAGHTDASVGRVARRAGEIRAATRSRTARAWLKLAMRAWGEEVEDTVDGVATKDVLLAAVDALGAEDGNWRVLRPVGTR